MKIANIVIAGTAALTILGSAAFAQEMRTGTITRIDRTTGTVVIQQTQSGTTGAGTGGAAEQFKAQGGQMLEAVHAGDKVSFTASEAGGVKTLTKLEKAVK